MARPARADHRELLINAAVERLYAGSEIRLGELCRELGIAASLANHYFTDKDELVREAWLRVVLAFITEDYAQLDEFGREVNWQGVEQFIFNVFSPERSKARQTHIQGLGQGFADQKLGTLIDAAQKETTKKWLGLLQRYTESGVLTPKVDLNAMAILFAAIPIGVTAVQGALSPEERSQITRTWLAMLRSVL